MTLRISPDGTREVPKHLPHTQRKTDSINSNSKEDFSISTSIASMGEVMETEYTPQYTDDLRR